MWVHPDDTQKDVQAEIKEAVFHGGACLLRNIFEEYEAFESEAKFSVDLISEASLAQRAVFAGETFLMIFDPAYSVPKKAMHEAFVVEFLMHTVSHIADEIEQSTFELRKDMFKVTRKVLKHTEVEYYFESNVEEWREDFSWIAAELVGNFDFEYSSMLNRLDELGASFVGKIFADLNLKDPNYFDGYSSSYIEKNMNEIVSRCAKIIDFIEKYQKSGNFRAHP